MKFYILQKDYSDDAAEDSPTDQFVVSSSTAIGGYRGWFFECLQELGSLHVIQPEDSHQKLKSLFSQPDTVVVNVNVTPRTRYSHIPYRCVWLTLGSLLLPDNFFHMSIIPPTQLLLLSTDYQRKKTQEYLGKYAPPMAVFSNKIDTDFFRIPSPKEREQARKRQNIREGQIHVVYAGRWIVTKGISQLIRALDIWPLPQKTILTLAGNVEKDFGIAFSLTKHRTFQHFVDDEVLQRGKRSWLRMQPAKDREALRDFFWSADLFVNPTTHPDEDFGVTPREALACGVPVVTTNFCGLQPVAEQMDWKGIDTYPTAFGSRFSLFQLRKKMEVALSQIGSHNPEEHREFVTRTNDATSLKKNLQEGLFELVKQKPSTGEENRPLEQSIRKKLYEFVGTREHESFIEMRNQIPKGAYVYGDGPHHNFLYPIVQGIYSARKSPPLVDKGSKYRGYFRLTFWKQEEALVEFGYPGPRIRRYLKSDWSSLLDCAKKNNGDLIFTPETKGQVKMIQELVDLGYLVPDFELS